MWSVERDRWLRRQLDQIFQGYDGQYSLEESDIESEDGYILVESRFDSDVPLSSDSDSDFEDDLPLSILYSK
jgi:hypothetical protein